MSRRTPPPAQSVTSAPEPLGADQARRARRYLIQMGIRVVCFLAAVLTWSRVPLWVSLVLIVGAVVLPYIAVLFANAGRERRDDAPPGYLPHLLDAAPTARPVAPAPPTPGPGPADEPWRAGDRPAGHDAAADDDDTRGGSR
ncbi:DUF3099 domain-containing protein [Cellulomonas sp. PS-H5]|uniref:DUF3099 domain-containing protein n=1 Tax=Cellulomonas sp. PS-H5 TaxID=2820400 RepID=UPI001C4FEC6A|nr:DUF3099 domain-containing protein [Cellulomonas sp. PS-H5]MBW0253177.1 DUF3099 domain-containing protein [Cellulomonas sp. PS-H5]